MTPHPSQYPPQMHPQQSHIPNGRVVAPQQAVSMMMPVGGNSPPRAPPPYSGAPPVYINRAGVHHPASSPPCQPPYQVLLIIRCIMTF